MARRTAELVELSMDELRERLTETKEEFFNLRFQNATGQLDNYKRLGVLKKDIARLKTVIRAREIEQGSAPEVDS